MRGEITGVAVSAVISMFLTFDGKHAVAKVFEVDFPMSVGIQVRCQLLHLWATKVKSVFFKMCFTKNTAGQLLPSLMSSKDVSEISALVSSFTKTGLHKPDFIHSFGIYITELIHESQFRQFGQGCWIPRFPHQESFLCCTWSGPSSRTNTKLTVTTLFLDSLVKLHSKAWAHEGNSNKYNVNVTNSDFYLFRYKST